MTDNKPLPESSFAPWRGLIAALIIVVSLAGIGNHDLWTPDEPREAAIALGMSQSGNLVIPELAGRPFVEKPPLFYMVASFFLLTLGKIIGNTAALRMASACFGLGTLFFTYLLGKICFDRQKALIATAILATMFGFVHVTHWLLVDNALMFFVVASIWALARAYPDLPDNRKNHLAFLLLAGIFAAGAFLTKGMAGPLIIALAWAGLFVPWIKTSGAKEVLSKKSISFHFAGLIITILISAIWVVLFIVKSGPELFHEWWWTNHFGRFTGQAVHLGHISPWYYYLGVLPIYILPWLAPFIIALITLSKKFLRTGPIPARDIMLIMWILGSFALLSLSATKREVYLSVLLPACALLCIYGLDLPSPTVAGFPLRQGYGGQAAKAGDRWTEIWKKTCWLWMFLLFLILATFTGAPLVSNEFFGLALTFGWQQVLALATVIVSIPVLSFIKAPFLQRFLVVSLMCYSTLLIAICPYFDQHKSYGPAFRAAAKAIRACPELKVAGWNLDETTIAGFYYYSGLVFPAVPDQKTLDDILKGHNPRFNGVLTLEKNTVPNDLSDKKNQVIFESRMGKRRLLRLLAAEGTKPPIGREIKSKLRLTK